MMNSGDAVGRYTGIRLTLCSSKYKMSLLYEIYSVAAPYPRISNILEICGVSALRIYRMCFR